MANHSQTADEQAAIRSFEAALTERKRLEALRATLIERCNSVRNAADAARKAADAADVDAMLVLPEMRDDARWDGHHLHERAREAEGELQIIEAALRAMPGKLSDTDEGILTAIHKAAPAIASARDRMMDAYHAEMSAAMQNFLPLLLKGLALANAIDGGQRYVENSRLDSPSRANGMRLQSGTLFLDDIAIKLQDAWREDSAAKAAYGDLRPLHELGRLISSHQHRIQAMRRDAEIQRSFATPARRHYNPLPPSTPDPNYRPPWYPRAGGVEPVRSYMVRPLGNPEASAAIERKEKQLRQKRDAEAARYADRDPSNFRASRGRAGDSLSNSGPAAAAQAINLPPSSRGSCNAFLPAAQSENPRVEADRS